MAAGSHTPFKRFPAHSPCARLCADCFSGMSWLHLSACTFREPLPLSWSAERSAGQPLAVQSEPPDQATQDRVYVRSDTTPTNGVRARVRAPAGGWRLVTSSEGSTPFWSFT